MKKKDSCMKENTDIFVWQDCEELSEERLCRKVSKW